MESNIPPKKLPPKPLTSPPPKKPSSLPPQNNLPKPPPMVNNSNNVNFPPPPIGNLPPPPAIGSLPPPPPLSSINTLPPPPLLGNLPPPIASINTLPPPIVGNLPPINSIPSTSSPPPSRANLSNGNLQTLQQPPTSSPSSPQTINKNSGGMPPPTNLPQIPSIPPPQIQQQQQIKTSSGNVPPSSTPPTPPTTKPLPNYNRPLSPTPPQPLSIPPNIQNLQQNRPLSPPPPLPTHNSSSNLSGSNGIGNSSTYRNSTDSLPNVVNPQSPSTFLDQPEIYPQTRIAEENFNYLKDIFNKITKRSQSSSTCTREGNSLAESFKNYGTMLISQSDNQLGQCLFKVGDFQREYENFRELLDVQSLSGLKGTVDQFINKDMKVVRASRKNFDKMKTMFESVDTKVTHNASKGKGINLVKQAELQQERDYLKSKVVQVGIESLSTIKLANESNSVEIMEQIVEYMETMHTHLKSLTEQVNQLQPSIANYKKEAIRRRQDLDKMIEQSQKPTNTSNASSISISQKESKVYTDELDRIVPGEEPKKARLRRFISGERNYISSLNTLVTIYLSGLRTDDRLFSKIFKEDEVAIFSNIELVYSNQNKFLEELENCLKQWGEPTNPSIGAVFFRNAPKLMQLYSTYINNFSKALVTIGRCKQSRNFQAFLKTCEEKSDGTDLDSLIPLPLTRITNYLIFLQDYKETLSQNQQDQTELKHVLGAKDKIQSISELVEQSHNLIQISKLQQSLTGYDSTLVEEGRFLIKEAMIPCSIQNTNVGSTSQVSSYYFILLTDILIYCKKQNVLFPVISLSDWSSEGTKSSSYTNSKYKFIGKFDLKNMDIKATQESISNLSSNSNNSNNSSSSNTTDHSFQVVGTGGVSIATLYFETKSIKEEWFATIKKAISKCNQNKLFGIPLETLYQRPTELGRAIPSFLQRIVDYVYDHGPAEEGIFRLSANQKSLDLAKEEIETGVELDYSEMDMHAVAGLLKLWVRNLPEPLLTFKYYDAFIAVADLETKQERYNAIKQIVEKIPLENRFCIYYLMRMLTKVSESSSTNKMTPNNISIVFATLLLKKQDANPMDCTNFNTIFGVIECFMTGFKEIFVEVEKQYQDHLSEQSNPSKRKSVMPNKPLPILPPIPNSSTKPNGLMSNTSNNYYGGSNSNLGGSHGSNNNLSSFNGTGSLGSNSSGGSSSGMMSSSDIEWTKQTFDEGSDSEDEGFSIGSKQASITIQLGEIVKQGYLTKKGAMRRNWTKRWFVLKQGYLFYFKTSKDKKPKGIIQLIGVQVTRSYYKPNCMAIRSTIGRDDREFLIVATSQSDLEDWITNITKCTTN